MYGLPRATGTDCQNPGGLYIILFTIMAAGSLKSRYQQGHGVSASGGSQQALSGFVCLHMCFSPCGCVQVSRMMLS